MSDLPPVLIVGAGPTGMTAALDLAHYGIPSIILDEDNHLSDGSRGIAYHWSALAVWEKLGAGEAMLAKGIAWSRRHTYFGTREVYTQNFAPPAPGALPSFLNLQQYYVERFLLDRIEAEPLIDLHWNHRVTAASQTPEGITLEAATTDGPRQFSARYVLACDGARSTLRKLLSLDFPGRTFEDRFLICDIRADLDTPREPRFFFNHPTHPGSTVLIHPQPDSVWRIDWQIGAGADSEAERSPERMDARIRAFIGDVPYKIVWLSDYRFHQRLLARFRHGNIFFLGDSAHLVAPFGARGMNSAVQDVENLVWKLALVLNGAAPDGLLDTYQAERWAAQAENQRVTIETMKFMAPSTRWQRLRRELILRLSIFYPPARKWVNSGRMSIPFVYGDSPLTLPDDGPVAAWKDAPVLGAKLADRPLTIWQDGGRTSVRLRRLTGSGFVVLYAARDEADAERFVREAPLPEGPVPCQAIPVLEGLAPLPAGSAILLRPDGHLAARRKSLDPGQIAEMIERICLLSH
ncbi:MAG TPA: FAD-dependent monooxygenase [Anaerolineales bacterium]|nr:FAD-dependent monooxygenase [Anaerolineales bacterium]